jgi:osmoprotectant transport system permease protein
MLQDILSYYRENMSEYWSAVMNHFTISLQVVLIASILGIPLGIICAKQEKIAKWISGIVNILKVIPSLALMVLMIPVIGIGRFPALVALTIIAVPAIMINTAAGFLSIDPLLLETAKGMGMSKKQSFFSVEAPLAFPLCLTGIRTAAVETIATTSIAAYIGAGGLGNMVFTGLGVNRTDILLLGGLSIAIMSITIDLILSILQTRVGQFINHV